MLKQSKMAPGFAYSYGLGNGTQMNDTMLTETYKRDSQLQYKAERVKQIAKAYEKPQDFFNEKAAAIEYAAGKAADVYKDAFRRFIDKRLPGGLAHERAMKMAANYEALLLADVEMDYPSDLNNLSLDLTYDQGSAAKSGFATPSVALKHKSRK